MDVIPGIDIRGGRCVRLVQGDYAQETVFGDPLEMARHWVDLGARRLHVVDLDGARERRSVNDSIIRSIIDECGVPVQVAGGMRDAATVDAWARAGADRIVVGTLAVEQPDELERALGDHRDRIAVAIDARDGMVATRGWLETSSVSVADFITRMTDAGVQRFVYTDTRADGTLGGVDLRALDAVVARVREATRTAPDDEAPLIAGGGVASVDDVVAMDALGIEGVISGRALYDGRLDLRAAMRALAVGDDW